MATIRRHQIKSTQTGKVRLVRPGPGLQGFLGMTHNDKKGKPTASWEKTGKVEFVNDDGTVEIGPDPDAAARPADSANKAEWVDYVETLGGDAGDKTVDELKAAADELEQA